MSTDDDEEKIGKMLEALPDAPGASPGWQDRLFAKIDENEMRGARANLEVLLDLRAATAGGSQRDVRRYVNELGRACDTVERRGDGMLEELGRLRAFHDAWLRVEIASAAITSHVDACQLCGGEPGGTCEEGIRLDRAVEIASKAWVEIEKCEAARHGIREMEIPA